MSELLRLYLRSAIGQPKQQRPWPGAWEGGRGSPFSHHQFHQITKADPRNVIGAVSDAGKASLQHCEYISSGTVLPLLPEWLDGFQMGEEVRRRGVKRASGTAALMALRGVNNSAALRRPGRRLPGGNNEWRGCSRAGSCGCKTGGGSQCL